MSNPLEAIGRAALNVKDFTLGSAGVTLKATGHYVLGSVCVVGAVGAVGSRTVARTLEMAGRTTFNESSAPTTEARICAYCSYDVYKLEYDRRPLPPTKQTVQVKDACCTIQPVPKPSWAPDLGTILYQIYLVDDDKVVLAFKGTNNAREFVDDVAIIVGNFHVVGKCVVRGNCELSIAEKLQEEYGRSRIFFTGHSLGGAAATFLAASDTKNYECIEAAHVFNPGTGYVNNDCDTSNPIGLLRDFARPVFRAAAVAGVTQAKICAHHIFGDVISFLTTGSDMISVITYMPATIRPHRMANFL